MIGKGFEGSEAEAMDGAGTVLAEGGEVGLGAIAFVSGKAVCRPLCVVVAHEGVARLFGDDGGSCDRLGARVTFDNGLSGDFGCGKMGPVDEQKVGLPLEVADGYQHGLESSLKDVDFVDDLRFDNADAVINISHSQKALEDGKTLGWKELLAVIDPVDQCALGQNTGSGYNWAGQRTSTGFIYACNTDVAFSPSRALKMAERICTGLQ